MTFQEKDLEDMLMEGIAGKTRAPLSDRGFLFLDEALKYPHRVERQVKLTGVHGIMDIAVFSDLPAGKHVFIIELKRDAIGFDAIFQAMRYKVDIENQFVHPSDDGGYLQSYGASVCIVGSSLFSDKDRNGYQGRDFLIAATMAGVEMYTYGFGFDYGIQFERSTPSVPIWVQHAGGNNVAWLEMEYKFPTRREFAGAPDRQTEHREIKVFA